MYGGGGGRTAPIQAGGDYTWQVLHGIGAGGGGVGFGPQEDDLTGWQKAGWRHVTTYVHPGYSITPLSASGPALVGALRSQISSKTVVRLPLLGPCELQGGLDEPPLRVRLKPPAPS